MHTKFYTHDLKQRRLSIFRAARGDAMLQNIAMFLGKKGRVREFPWCFVPQGKASVGGNPWVVGFGATPTETSPAVIFIS